MLSAAGGSANEASLPEPIGSKPTASLRLRRRLRLLPPLRGCGCGRGVFCSVLRRRLRPPSSPSAPPPLRGRCSMLATCARGVCWRRFASPSSLRSSPVGRGRPPSRTLRALTTRSSRTRIPRSPQRSTRYRYAFGSLSMRELASLRSAVPAVRDGGVLAGGSRRVSAWVWYRHAFAAEPLRIVTKNQSGARAIGRRKRRSAKGRLGVREADLSALRVSRLEERSDSANMAPKVA